MLIHDQFIFANFSSSSNFLFVLLLMSQVNSYGHGGTVSLPNHTLFLGKLEQAVNMYFVHILSLVTDNIQLMHSFEVNIRICQPKNSDVHRGEAEVNITFEG